MKHYRGWILAALLLLIIMEMIWSWRKDKKAYEVKETLANLSILAGFEFSKLLFAGYQLLLLGVAADWAFFTLPHNVWTFIACFFLADLIYYWFHRVSHHWKPLWAFHLIHHSAMTMNLTAAYRLNWFGALISPLFFIPLALLGFPPDYIVASYALNLLYQFFLHTEAVPGLGPIEGLLDTPSAHRVHHGSNPVYIDKNFGGVLMIWDRLFKTYQPETEKVRYGLTTGFVSNNPFALVFKGFIDLFKTMLIPGLIILSTLKATAQDAGSMDKLKASTPEQRAHFQDSLMRSRLSLTDPQYGKVAAINLKYARKIEPLIKSDASQFSIYRKVRPLLTEKEKELRAVFTKEQAEKYEAVKEEMKAEGKKAYNLK